MRCEYLLPRPDVHIVSTGDQYPQCLLEVGHNGDEHLIRNFWGHFILWQPYDKCMECGPGECDCFLYRKISKDVAQELLAESRGGER